MEGERDNSFDVRYMLMLRQCVSTVRAILCLEPCVHADVCGCSVVASSPPPQLFDACISPAVMTVAAAGCVSGELIISVCHPW